MSKVLDILSQSALSSLSDADLLYAASGGELHPVSVANARKSLMGSKSVSVGVNGGEWIAVAKFTAGIASCILMATHGGGSGMPVPLAAAVAFYKDRQEAMLAEPLTSGDWFSKGLSFPAVRFAKNGDSTYLEVMLKGGARTTSIYTAIGMPIGMELIAPAISTASESDVLKTISFVGGVKHCLYLWKGGVRHERHKRYRLSWNRNSGGKSFGIASFGSNNEDSVCYPIQCLEPRVKYGFERLHINRSVRLSYRVHECTSKGRRKLSEHIGSIPVCERPWNRVSRTASLVCGIRHGDILPFSATRLGLECLAKGYSNVCVAYGKEVAA